MNNLHKSIQIVIKLLMKQTPPHKQLPQSQWIDKIAKEIALLSQQTPTNKPQQRHKQIALLNLRLHLLQKKKHLDQSRLSTLQKIFKHYCNHMFKAGRHLTFARLQYEKSHLTMERFFAFINDFALNQASTTQSVVNVLSSTQIILLFKKASSNAKNLQFSEFVACIESLAIVYFDARHSYEQRKALQMQEKKKRWAEYLKKEQIKKLKAKQKSEEEKIHKEEIENKQQNIQNENNEEQKLESPQQQNNENDNLVKEMMEDQSIVHPNKQVPEMKKTIQNNESVKNEQINELYLVTKQEKIEYYYELMCIDNSQQVLSRLRNFEKELYKSETLPQPKQDLALPNSNRIQEIKIQLQNREKIKNKSILARSLSEQEYMKKKKKSQEKHYSNKKEGVTKSNKEDLPMMELSLEKIKQSSLDDLNLKANLQKFALQDETDKIFMLEYEKSENNHQMKRVASSVSRNNIAAQMKKRAFQIQNQQKINDQKKIARFGLQRLKNQHYIGKFLQRKW